MSIRPETFAEILPVGKENAVSTAELCSRFGIQIRELRQDIHDARQEGVLICSCHSGYYLPETVEDLQETYATLHKKSVSLLAVLKCIRREIKAREAAADENEKGASDSAQRL